MCFFFKLSKPKTTPHINSNIVEIEYITSNGNSKQQIGELVNLELDGDDDVGFYYVLTLKLPNGRNKKFKEYHLNGKIKFNGKRFSDLKELKEYTSTH